MSSSCWALSRNPPLGHLDRCKRLLNSPVCHDKEVLPNYFSWPSDPLKVYHCPDAYCPGGLPGTCEGGRLGPTCAECPTGTYWSNEGCLSCGISMQVAWVTGITLLVVAMICSYYASGEVYRGRATLQECAKIGVDMMLAFMQNLGVLTAVQVPWPVGLRTQKGKA